MEYLVQFFIAQLSTYLVVFEGMISSRKTPLWRETFSPICHNSQKDEANFCFSSCLTYELRLALSLMSINKQMDYKVSNVANSSLHSHGLMWKPQKKDIASVLNCYWNNQHFWTFTYNNFR